MLHKSYPLSSIMRESPVVSFEEAGKILGGLHPIPSVNERRLAVSDTKETLRIRSLQAVLHRAASNEHRVYSSQCPHRYRA
jgi:hypothetical protein